MAESSLSQRRQHLPFEVFEHVLSVLLRPIADETKHPDGFYRGLRLLGLDGTTFSARNTAGILSVCTKAVSRRLEAAFAKLGMSVLMEISTHAPVNAEIGREGESEWERSVRLVKRLPSKSLVLGDKLHGVPAFIREFPAGEERFYLFRSRENLTATVQEKMSDGSRLVEIAVRSAGGNRKVLWSTVVREIRARVGRRGFRYQEVRLFTNMFDETRYPAQELVELYAQRWEQEMSYRETKHSLRQGELLDSQTHETACQEMAALLIAASVVAEHRLEIAQPVKKMRVTAVAFGKALFYTQHLWYFFLSSEGILSPTQQQEMAKRFRALLLPEKVPKKRSRSCPRAVRQPIKGWPRKLNQKERNGPINITLH